MQNQRNQRTKLCAVLLVAVMAFTMMPVAAFAQEKAVTANWADSADVSWFKPNDKKPSYTLSTAQQLAGFAKIMNQGEAFHNITIGLSADIDLSGKLWTTAGSGTAFKGTFDGKNHTIKNLTINENTNGSGFIRTVDHAAVKNLQFTGADLTVDKSAGTICGFSQNGSKISNITVDGTITGTGNWIGGITGNNNKSQIINCNTNMVLSTANGATYGLLAGWSGGDSGSAVKGCTTKGSVSSTDYCGGAVGGSENTKYESVSSDATVTSTANTASTGGLVGWSSGDALLFCRASGTVTHETGSSGGYTGGLIGWLENGTVERCSASAVVSQAGTAGMAGGLVGYFNGNATSWIKESAATGTTVTGTNRSSVGGLIGAGAAIENIENCYATSHVVTGGQLNNNDLSAEAGALIGILHDGGQIKNCYAAGNATAGKTEDDGNLAKKIRASRFIADMRGNSPTITNCYYNSDSTLTNDSPAKVGVTEVGTGKTSEELQAPDMITSLNVDTDVWGPKDSGYPILKNMKEADYTAVDIWIEKANQLDQSKYVDFSGVEKALESVIAHLHISKQTEVDGYAAAIEAAIQALVEKTDPPAPGPDPHIHTPAADDGDCSTPILCTGCGATLTPAKSHNFSGTWQTDSSNHWHSCTNGGCTKDTGRAAHTWDSGTVTTPPTMEQEGVKTFTCTTCSQTKTEVMEKLPSKEEVEDPETGSKIEYEDGTPFDETVELIVTPQPQKENDKYANAVDKAAKGLTIAELYDVKLLKDGAQIQPGGKLKVTLKLTEAMKAMTKLQVIYIEDQGKVTIMPSQVGEDNIVFTTDHFSYYGVIGKEAKKPTPPAPTKIAAPKTVKTKALSQSSVRVTWNKVSKAKEYAVYRATSKTGRYTLVKKLKGNTTDIGGLKANKTYYFKIRTKGAAGYGGYSKAVSAKTKKACPCGQDHSKAWFKLQQSGKSTVKVTWTPQKGAKSYQVANNHTSSKAMKIKWTGNNKQHCYLSLGKAKGKNYQFKMRTVTVKNGKNVYGSWTSKVCITMK